jgi:CO dehydrogenase maturation factor
MKLRDGALLFIAKRSGVMKLAVGGKGGVGKTTVVSCLAKAFGGKGYHVLAIDADPNATLAGAFGLQDAGTITPIVKMDDLIEERTGARPGQSGGIFQLNPRVDDIPDRFCRPVEPGISMMVMGAMKLGGGGCYCPENAMLKALVTHLLLARNEVVILDMEAGIEHLGRGTTQAVDRLIVVVEPGRRSIDTAHAVQSLAADIGLTRLGVIANKVRGPQDESFIRENMAGFDLLGSIPYSEKIIEADMAWEPAYIHDPELVPLFDRVVERLMDQGGDTR